MDFANIKKTLLKFAEENFGDKYFVSLDGENKRIRPLELAVKRRRLLWMRPFAKNELIFLNGLEKYVEDEGKEEFCRAINSIITEEELSIIKPKVSHGACSRQFGVDISGAMEVTVKLHEDLGDLGLGKLSQKYITDPDIRGLLERTALDVKKMQLFDEDQLYLIASVIYSEKFELVGGRKKEFLAPRWGIMQDFLDLQTGKERLVPRSVPAPIFFKCCRVYFNKKNNRLELGKNIRGQTVCV